MGSKARRSTPLPNNIASPSTRAARHRLERRLQDRPPVRLGVSICWKRLARTVSWAGRQPRTLTLDRSSASSLLGSFPSPDVAEQHHDGARRRPIGITGPDGARRPGDDVLRGSSVVSIHRRHTAVAGRRQLEVRRLPERRISRLAASRRSRASEAKLFECTPHSGLAHMDSDTL